MQLERFYTGDLSEVRLLFWWTPDNNQLCIIQTSPLSGLDSDVLQKLMNSVNNYDFSLEAQDFSVTARQGQRQDEKTCDVYWIRNNTTNELEKSI